MTERLVLVIEEVYGKEMNMLLVEDNTPCHLKQPIPPLYVLGKSWLIYLCKNHNITYLGIPIIDLRVAAMTTKNTILLLNDDKMCIPCYEHLVYVKSNI